MVGATLARRVGFHASPSSANTTTVHVGAAAAARIAAILNALPTQAGGMDAGGGPDLTVTVTFDGDLLGPTPFSSVS